jgi:hypothetical protein
MLPEEARRTGNPVAPLQAAAAGMPPEVAHRTGQVEMPRLPAVHRTAEAAAMLPGAVHRMALAAPAAEGHRTPAAAAAAAAARS